MKNSYLPLFLGICLSLSAFSCTLEQTPLVDPPNYHLSSPERLRMPDALQEISGIGLIEGRTDTIYAIEDESGKVYQLPLKTLPGGYSRTYFAEKGDYEDIAIGEGWVHVLKSNGTIYSFRLEELRRKKATGVQVAKGLLPKGEYEALFKDPQSGLIYVLCKECKQDKGSEQVSGFILKSDTAGILSSEGAFQLKETEIRQINERKKGSFHPSALARHPISGEWYILSSVNRALLIADENWKIKGVYHLSSNLFNQPEGITFDKEANLYISNEGSETQNGNVLKFSYHSSTLQP